MGLTDKDKAEHPFYIGLKLEDERKRWEKFVNSPEYVEITEKFRCAVEDHLHQRLKAYLTAKDIKRPTVGIVVATTSDFTRIICDDLVKTTPYLTEKMLERFDLVKKKDKP